MQTGALRVRSLGHGVGIQRVALAANKLPQGHQDAILEASLRGSDVIERNPRLAALPWSQVHLVHVTFAPGTSRSVAQRRLPIGLRGVQLGAAATTRGHLGHLHAYALMYVGP